MSPLQTSRWIFKRKSKGYSGNTAMQRTWCAITNQIAGLQSTCNRFITQLWDSQVEKGMHPIYKCFDIAHQEACRFQTLSSFQEIFWTQPLLVPKSEKIVRSQNAAGGHGQRLAIFRESLKPAVRCKCSTISSDFPPRANPQLCSKNLISSAQNVWGCDCQ